MVLLFTPEKANAAICVDLSLMYKYEYLKESNKQQTPFSLKTKLNKTGVKTVIQCLVVDPKQLRKSRKNCEIFLAHLTQGN